MDTGLCPYRLKSARRKKRLQREDRDKQLLKMEKEYKRLKKTKAELPFIPLEKPYQRGWMRLFVLRSEIAKGDKADFYQGILDAINQVQYHYEESFRPPKRKERRHKYYFEKLPVLQTIDRFRWWGNQINLTDEQRACFRKMTFWDERYYRWEYYYDFTNPELFEFAVLPRMVDKVRMQDEGLEREMAFIKDRLYKEPNWSRVWKLKGGSYKNWYSKAFCEQPKYRNPLKNKSLNRIWDEHMDDFMPVVDDYGHNHQGH